MKPVYGPRRTVYENPHQRIYCVRAESPEGGRDIYVTDYGLRAAILVEGPQGILLTRQYRYLTGALSFEIPGGRADDGEAAADAAARECLEETGIRPLNLAPLVMFHPGLDTLHNPTHVFHTSSFEDSGAVPHAGEVQSIAWVALPDCLAMITEGKIVDSLSLIALLSYARLQETR